VLELIEKLKQDLTDKYVVVDAHVPELARFEGHVGQVKTVNMNGRALVEFDAWSNIGWYDIEPSYLKVVPKPEPTAAAGKPAAKAAAPAKAASTAQAPAGEKKLSPLEMARLQGAAKPAGAQPSAKPAAAQPAAPKAAPTAQAAGGKPSTADILAAARGGESAPAAQTPAVEPAQAAAAVETLEQPVATAPKPAASKPAFTAGERPSVPEILAWCRQHDAK